MGNFVLQLIVAVGGAHADYPGPPSLAMSPAYYASMTACIEAGRRAQRDIGGARTGVRFSCSYRGDAYTSRHPFEPW